MSAPGKVQQISASDNTTRSVSAGSERTVYLLPRRNEDNIVDLVLKIMDGEGPRPMKNLRPAQKTRNGADQFYDDHHGEYEARGQPSRDKLAIVHTHNNAFPKMYDELAKRRSTAQPTAFASNQKLNVQSGFDPNCPICVQLKKQSERNQRRRQANKRTRQPRGFRMKSNTRNAKSKMTKAKKSQRRTYRSPSKVFKLSRIRTNKGCQCTSYMVPAETKSVTVATFSDNNSSVQQQEGRSGPSPSTAPNNENHENYELKLVKSPMQNKKPSKSDVDSGNPETNSAPSVSSYNSFMSMEHEPMVE